MPSNFQIGEFELRGIVLFFFFFFQIIIQYHERDSIFFRRRGQRAEVIIICNWKLPKLNDLELSERDLKVSI